MTPLDLFDSMLDADADAQILPATPAAG